MLWMSGVEINSGVFAGLSIVAIFVTLFMVWLAGAQKRRQATAEALREKANSEAELFEKRFKVLKEEIRKEKQGENGNGKQLIERNRVAVILVSILDRASAKQFFV